MRIWIMATALLVMLASLAGVALAHVSSGDAEVRIAARRLDNGVTEFALQHRVDGQWGEEILPTSRFFPANPGSDRWLRSSALTIETTADEEAVAADAANAEALQAAQTEAAAANEALAAAEAALAKAQEAPAIVRDAGQRAFDDGRIVTKVRYVGTASGLSVTPTSEIRVRADGDFGLRDKPLTLLIACERTGGRTVEFENAPPPVEGDPYPSGYIPFNWIVSYRFVPAPETGDLGAVDVSWQSLGQSYDQTTDEWNELLGPQNALRFFLTLRSAEQLEIVVIGADDETVEATFSMAGVWDTPIQPNLDHCGDYH